MQLFHLDVNGKVKLGPIEYDSFERIDHFVQAYDSAKNTVAIILLSAGESIRTGK